MVYVTHDQTEAMSMADQVVLLREGRVEQDAAPAALYARPATAFAARFIGTPPMNLVRLARGARGALIRGTESPAVAPGPGDGLLLGVRPEAVRIDAAGAPATVVSMEYLGADSIVACTIGEEPFIVRAPGKLELAAGARIGLAWPREAQHFFRADDGRRVEPVQGAAIAA
jgi:sn-glycerol 3-phosphate transport system ATP-binding protein